MILKTLRLLIFLFLASIISIWIVVQTDQGESWTRKTIENAIRETTGKSVHIKHISGVLPLYIKASDITIEDPDCQNITIDSIECVPNWFSLLAKRVSLFYLSVDGLDLSCIPKSQSKPQDSKAITLPKVPIHLWAIQGKNIRIPSDYSRLLLNGQMDDLKVDITYAFFAKLHYSPEKPEVKANISLSPFADDSSLGNMKIKAKMTKKETTCVASIDVKRPPSGSVFVQTGLDQFSFSTKLQANTKELLSGIRSTSEEQKLLSGSWQLLAVQKKEPTVFSGFYRLTASGDLSFSNQKTLSFLTKDTSLHDISSQGSNNQVQTLGPNESRSLQDAYFYKIPINGNISGTFSWKEKFKLLVTSDSFSFADFKAAPFHFSVLTDTTKGEYKLDSILHYKTKKVPVSTSSRFSTDSKTFFSLTGGSLSVASYPIDYDLTFLFYPFQIIGSIQNSDRQCDTLLSLFDIDGKAMLDISGRFSKNETASLDISLQNLISDSLEIRSFDFSTTTNGLFPDAEIITKCTLSDLDTEELTLDELNITGSVDMASHDDSTVSFDFLGSRFGTKFSSDGEISLRFSDAVVATIEEFRLQAKDFSLLTDAPFYISYKDDTCTVSAFSFSHNHEKVLSGSYTHDSTSLNGRLEVENFALDLLHPVVARPLYGTFSGILELYGKPSKPQLHLTAASSDLSFFPITRFGLLPQMVSLQVNYQNERASVDVEVQNIQMKEPIQCAMQLPVSFTLSPFTLSYRENEVIKGDFSGNFSIESLFQEVDKPRPLAGEIDCKLQLHGSFMQPKLFGSLTVENGRFVSPSTGTTIQNIQASCKFEKQKARLETCSANDSLDGSLSATGSLFFPSLDDISYSLDASLDTFKLLSRSHEKVSASGNITLSGSKKEAFVQGALNVDKAAIEIASSSDTDIPEVDITFINKKEYAKKRQPFLLSLDLDILLDKNLVISGRGLNSNWDGKIHVAGTFANSILSGGIESVSGTFHFADRVFTITKGTVDFKGELGKSQLNIIASCETQDITAQILLKGALNSPKIFLQSSPSMSEKEILSWLIFNKSSSEITPMQGLQLAQVAMKLKSDSSSPDIIDSIKGTFGIDRIDFGPSSSIGPKNTSGAPMQSANNDVSFQVGKYISDGVMVMLSNDVTNEVNRIGIEAELTKHIVAQAYVGDDAETQVGLQWKYRYK